MTFPGVFKGTEIAGGLSYAGNDAVGGVNSELSAVDATVVTPALITQGWIGAKPGSTDRTPASQIFKRFRYAPSRKTQAELLSSIWWGLGATITPLVGNPAKLSWPPLPQVNPTFVKVNPDGTTTPSRTFGDTEDVYVVGPTNVPVNGGRTVLIRGGRRVRFISGELVNELDGPSGTVLRFRDQTEQVFVEGLIMDKKGHKGDALVWDLRPNCDLIVQNCHVSGIAGDEATHGDVMQVQGPVRHIMVDKLTGDSTYNGILIPGRKVFDGREWGIGKGYFRRVNLKLTHDQFPNSSWNLLYLRDSCTDLNNIKWPLTLEEVYLETLTKPFADSFQPTTDQGACGGTISTDATSGRDYVSWPVGEGIEGKAWDASPASGDFVPRTNVGRGYASPGYLDVPYVS